MIQYMQTKYVCVFVYALAYVCFVWQVTVTSLQLPQHLNPIAYDINCRFDPH